MVIGSALYTLILENFWTKLGLKVLFRIPSIWTNFASSCWVSFSRQFQIHNSSTTQRQILWDADSNV